MRSVVLLRRSLLAAGLTGVSAAFFGIGSREMADDAIDSLVAVPFTAEIMAGKSVDLDVLGQAYAPNVAESLTIEGISQPASGSVSVISNRIRYTSNSGFAGVDSFTYTLTAEGKSSTATIVITVRSSVSDPQTGSRGDALPPPGGSSAIPGSTGLWNPVQGIDIPSLTPTTTHNVSNASQLAAAINTINTTSAAGHHTVLADGSYSGNYTIYAQGTQSNPIVIRPSSFLGATLTGTLTICGSWVIVRGLNTRSVTFGKVTSPATYRATNSRLSRCIIPSGSGLTLRDGASYCCVDRSEFIGSTGYKIQIRPRAGADNTLRNCVVWSLIRDNLNPTDGSRQPTVQSNAGSYSLFNMDTQFLLGWNRIQNGNNDNTVQFKASGNTAIYNTITNGRNFSLTHRHGRRSYFGGNWIQGGVLNIRGEGHAIIGNVSTSRIQCEPGNIEGGSAAEPSWNSSVNGVGWTFAEDAKLIGNNCGITVDGPNGTVQPYAPLRTLIESHTGSVSIVSGARQAIDRRNDPPSQVVPVAYELLASQVGPYS